MQKHLDSVIRCWFATDASDILRWPRFKRWNISNRPNYFLRTASNGLLVLMQGCRRCSIKPRVDFNEPNRWLFSALCCFHVDKLWRRRITRHKQEGKERERDFFHQHFVCIWHKGLVPHWNEFHMTGYF